MNGNDKIKTKVLYMTGGPQDGRWIRIESQSPVTAVAFGNLNNWMDEETISFYALEPRKSDDLFSGHWRMIFTGQIDAHLLPHFLSPPVQTSDKEIEE